MPNMPLDSVLARSLNRARTKIPLSQTDLARRAGLAQGTVSNFLRAKPIRRDHADRILATFSAAIEEASLPLEQATAVRETISRARSALGELKHERRVGGVVGSSWEPSDYFVALMALTDEPRLNLTKSFDYRNKEHFGAHVTCVANGIKYRWVAYDADTLLAEWQEYTDALQSSLKIGHRDELQEKYKKRITAKDIDALLREQVQCRILPRSAQRTGQMIPFRITVFGSDVCLCVEERAKQAYPHGAEYFVLPAPEIKDLKIALENLFDVCPPIGENCDASSVTIERCRKYHDRLRSAFLQVLVKKMEG